MARKTYTLSSSTTSTTSLWATVGPSRTTCPFHTAPSSPPRNTSNGTLPRQTTASPTPICMWFIVYRRIALLFLPDHKSYLASNQSINPMATMRGSLELMRRMMLVIFYFFVSTCFEIDLRFRLLSNLLRFSCPHSRIDPTGNSTNHLKFVNEIFVKGVMEGRLWFHGSPYTLCKDIFDYCLVLILMSAMDFWCENVNEFIANVFVGPCGLHPSPKVHSLRPDYPRNSFLSEIN